MDVIAGRIFFLTGIVGLVVFIYAARSGRRIWPLWLSGVGVILFGATLLLLWWTRGPLPLSSHDPGGLGLAIFIIAVWASSGIAALSLAAVPVFIFKRLTAPDSRW